MRAETGQADDGPAVGQHAIVIGAGIAGLVAARVLTDQFAYVTLIERDALPPQAAPRPGVPQARHVHVLLLRGQRLLAQLFPGLPAELTAAGAPVLNWTRDWAIFQNGGWVPRCASDYVGFLCSRDLLEACLRARLRQRGTVTFLEQQAVTGLVLDARGRAITGVRVRARGGAGRPAGAEAMLGAQFVVDASGRDSQAPQWLAALGYPAPAETTINAHQAYASRWYRPPPGRQPEVVLVGGTPPHEPYGGGVYPMEGGRWLVSLGGVNGVVPPLDEAGFLAFARGLPQPAVYAALQAAEPLTPIVGYQRTANRLRHYERLARQPEGFVVLGDAVCTFNPVYGQGMTVAALGAALLGRSLRAPHRAGPAGALTGVAQRFQRRLARLNATPWLLATGADLRWPGTTGGRPSRGARLVQAYIDQVLRVVLVDDGAYRVLLEVTHLLRPPRVLFGPQVVAAVVRDAVRRRGARP